MAYSTTMNSVSTKLREGWAEWIKTGYTLLSQFRAMLLAHTHTGTVDGAQIPAGGLASDSVITAKILDANVTTGKIANANVTAAKLATAAKTHRAGAMLDVAANDTTGEWPIFVVPSTVVITAIYFTTITQVVGQDTNYFTLTAYNRGTAGAGTAIVGTLTMNAAGGTVVALGQKAFTSIAGTPTVGQVITVAKGTTGSGLRMPLGCRVSVHYTLSD